MNSVKLIVCAALLSAGCHETSETPHYDGGGGTGGAATGPGGGGTATTSSTVDPNAPAPIPFAVDQYFAASGYMGDGESAGAVVDSAECPARAGEQKGLCHQIGWKPGAAGWAGVFWQYPEGNWGAAEGKEIEPGATRISFWAWGEKGNEEVSFFAGIQEVDGFHVELTNVALTTEPTQYFIKLGQATYGKVVGGFGWSSGKSDGSTKVVFTVDDIQWQKAEGGEGCTNPEATNYDPSATTEDGSCLFPVTFQVDMKAVSLDPADIVYVQSTFNQWCGLCNPMEDGDKDSIWKVTLPLAPGSYEHKYTTNGWDGLVEEVPLACDVTNGMFKNRGFTVTDKALTLPLHAWSECPP
ncbi:MAG: hypothetical protein R3B70_20295 [Polyangiaceae bacterium]